MPVTLHHVDQARWEADEQVRLDLVRIYQDAPQERIPYSNGGAVYGCTF